MFNITEGKRVVYWGREMDSEGRTPHPDFHGVGLLTVTKSLVTNHGQIGRLQNLNTHKLTEQTHRIERVE